MTTMIINHQIKLNDKKRTVLVGGCFDILHYGHIKFLEEAKKKGEYLVVLLESDETIVRLKGKDRPFHSQHQRKEMLLSLTTVDEVKELPPMTNDDEYDAVISQIRPAVIAVTDGDRITEQKKKQAERVGAEFIIIPKIQTPSTSVLSKLLGLE